MVFPFKNIYFTISAESCGYYSAIFPTDLVLNSTSEMPLNVFSVSSQGSFRYMTIYMETTTSLKAKMSSATWDLDVYGIK